MSESPFGIDDESTKAAIKDTTASEDPQDTIVLDAVKVLQDLGTMALAVAMMFGLMYTRNCNTVLMWN
ncbi:hypothetical protein UPYG_G00355160 [Umbra pygmaea]|uniref:Uncharacterized protein n=1 Tax=Umbra pygmaea TaxID=75934 RepID=A0ABD0VZ73_UMBPY